jgi:hypothetical protein
MPMPPAPAVIGRRNDKLVGNTPLIFKGEHSRAEEFITQWQLYEGVNITNDLMRNAYQRAMLFLTYIQGVTVSPSPQSKDEENEKLHELRRYARDLWRQHTTDAERFDWDSDDGDYGLAIGRLVIT